MPGLQRLNQAAASRNKRRQFDVLLTVTAPHERIMLTATALPMLALLLWAVFGRMEHDIMIDGVLIEPGDRHDVVAAESGHLLEYFAFPGDIVKAGELIARQNVPELDREVEELRRQLDLAAGGTIGELQDSQSSLSVQEEMRVALLMVEARRTTRETVVTHIAGEVMELRSGPGEFVAAGESIARIRSTVDAKEGPVHAVLRVNPRTANRIHPGMQATVEVKLPGSGTRRLEGEVISVTPGPLPEWLAAVPPVTAVNLHRIDIQLHQTPEGIVPNGTACRVRLFLGESPPAALLAPGLF